MAVNPNIALSVRGLELPDPLAQYGKVQAIQQAQQQNALAKMQMQQAQREVEQRNMLNQAYSQAYTPEGLDYNKLVSSLATGGLGSQIPEIEKQRQAALKAQSETTGAQLGVEKQRSELLNNVKRQMSLNPSDENIQRLGQQVIATGLFPAKVVNEELAAILQTPVEERQRLLSMSGAGVSDLAPKTMMVSGGDVNRLVEVSPTGQTRTLAEYGVGMTAAQQEQAKRDEQRLLNEERRLDIDARRLAQEEMKNTPEFKEAMARSEALGKRIAENDVQALSALPVITSKVEQGLDLIDTMIGKRDKNGNLLEGEAPHPGFSATVGATFTPGLRFVSGTPAADFMTYFDQITGQAFLEAFETLKGGGQITQIEGEKATSAINRMNIASSEREFIKAAMEFQDIMRAGLERAQKKAATAQQRMGGTSIPAGGQFMGFE